MLESFFSQFSNDTQTQRTLTYVKNDRMGGYVPKYEIKKPKEETISFNEVIENAMAGSQGRDTLTEQPQNDEQFGFFDLIDMVNPLHHVPIIGHLYREFTGDEIKPIAKIMGGAAFSGPIGVASAIIDTVVQNETGKDMASNAMAFTFGDDTPEALPSNNPPQQIASNAAPEQSIQNTLQTINDSDPDMTSALLSYSDLSEQSEALLRYNTHQQAEMAKSTIETFSPSSYDENENFNL